MEKIVHDLPQELITDILLRLPVKSLLRFKCVSKSWFSLISNPHFTSSHYDLQASRIVLFAASASEFRSIDVEASLHDDATLSLNFVPPQLHYKVKIMGSCRGFLLLECRSDLYIWNPSTGVHRQIPHRVDAGILKIFYGFGYNPSTDDYLVFIASSECKFLATLPVHTELYSLRGNTWEDINNTSFSYMLIAYNGPKVGCPLNGAIHWLAYGFNQPSYIATFDLTERNFSKIPLPAIENFGYDFKRCDLGVLGGFLSLYVVGWNEYEPPKIWVMKEYKMQSSWTKTTLVSNRHIPSFSPLCITKIGDIVGRDEYLGLVKCDDKGQVKEHRSYGDYSFRFQVAVYTDSLFSLPGDNQAEEDVTSPRLNCSWYTCMFEPLEWVKNCWRKLVFSP